MEADPVAEFRFGLLAHRGERRLVRHRAHHDHVRPRLSVKVVDDLKELRVVIEVRALVGVGVRAAFRDEIDVFVIGVDVDER